MLNTQEMLLYRLNLRRKSVNSALTRNSCVRLFNFSKNVLNSNNRSNLKMNSNSTFSSDIKTFQPPALKMNQKLKFQDYQKKVVLLRLSKHPKFQRLLSMTKTASKREVKFETLTETVTQNALFRMDKQLQLIQTILTKNGDTQSFMTTSNLPLEFDIGYEKIEMGPKCTLKQFYEKISNQLNSLEVLPKPETFIQDERNIWSCTYSVTWPKPMNFVEKGYTKKESSNNAASTTIKWLKDHHYMNELGKPLLLSSIGMGLGKVGIRAYSTSSNVDVNSNQTTQVNPSHVVQTKSTFPAPKNVLHNCYDVLSKELNKTDLKLSPQYKIMKEDKKGSWMCTYNLKWPEPMSFSEIAPTKKDASYKAAQTVLTWLKDNKKIDNTGRPLIYDKKEMIKITKKTYPSIRINRQIEERMKEIINIYENSWVDQLTVSLDEQVKKNELKVAEDFEDKWPTSAGSHQIQQKFLGLERYLASEPVSLPISAYKDQFIELLKENRILIIKGEPGCGKSTRVPQYVLEAWAKEGDIKKPCQIVVTQPRRIAAISLAERVADERQENVGSIVGYQIRLKSDFNNETGRILYCTTGILLRRLQSDPKLSDCTCVILDEAHERDVNTDLLMNLLKLALDLNPNLKLLVMSATIEAKFFQDYFNGASILHIPGFTYPVQYYYLDEKTKNFSKTYEMCQSNNATVVTEEVVNAIRMMHKNKPDGAILCFLPGWDEIMKVKKLLPDTSDMSVLCLHSKLQIAEQKKIFSRLPPGVRKVILATNIAETSVTIDDVVYVIDTGIHKEERFDIEKGVRCIDNHWISKASAIQRRGRAGRCQAGECLHLYPISREEQFLNYSIPEILRTSLTKIVLDSKVYSNNMNAMEFLQQLICPPEQGAVEKAVEELKELELLDENENLTPLGRILSDFQLPPKLSKAMVNAVIFKCVTPIVDIATLFSEEASLFAKTLSDRDEIKKVKSRFSPNSDHLALMGMFETWLNYMENENWYDAEKFCQNMGLVHYKLNTVLKIRNIHFDYLHKGLHNVLPISNDFSDNNELVMAVLLSGVGTVLQHRTWDIVKGRMKKSNVLLTRNNHKATITSESVNSRRGHFPTDFLVYINETVSNLRHTTLVRETSLISPLAVLLFRIGELEIEDVAQENFSDRIQSDDQVLLILKGTQLKFICDRQHAIVIQKCKTALRSCIQYYIYQLTKGGDYDSNVNKAWKDILKNLDKILVS